ncbi:hypothetical protein CON22_18015 [Bacillus cereus]|nr:hypothetical protein CON22_18015 [Bacillus cereus]
MTIEHNDLIISSVKKSNNTLDTTNIRISKAIHKKIKVLAVNEDIKMMDIANNAILMYEAFSNLACEKGVPTNLLIQDVMDALKK